MIAPLLVDAGWRVVAPFMRGYAPSSIPTDGNYHVGVLIDDALQVLERQARPGATSSSDTTGVRGRPMGLAAMADTPFIKAVIMSLPIFASFRPLGRAPDQTN